MAQTKLTCGTFRPKREQRQRHIKGRKKSQLNISKSFGKSERETENIKIKIHKLHFVKLTYTSTLRDDGRRANLIAGIYFGVLSACLWVRAPSGFASRIENELLNYEAIRSENHAKCHIKTSLWITVIIITSMLCYQENVFHEFLFVPPKQTLNKRRFL